MKGLKLILALTIVALGLSSCKDNDDYLVFVGTWGVEEIQYYNTGYYGNPIENTIITYRFTPGDPNDGIDLIYRSDRTGEMRDRSRDTLFVDNDTIICPDTTLVTKFTYSYHKDDGTLYMNMEVAHPFTYQMQIPEITENSFTYINEYDNNYVEKAWMRRISDSAKAREATRGSKPVYRPRRPGSLLSNY